MAFSKVAKSIPKLTNQRDSLIEKAGNNKERIARINEIYDRYISNIEKCGIYRRYKAAIDAAIESGNALSIFEAKRCLNNYSFTRKQYMGVSFTPNELEFKKTHSLSEGKYKGYVPTRKWLKELEKVQQNTIHN